MLLRTLVACLVFVLLLSSCSTGPVEPESRAPVRMNSMPRADSTASATEGAPGAAPVNIGGMIGSGG